MQKTPACVRWCFQAGCAGDGWEPIFCFHSSWEPSHFPGRTQAKSSWVPISSPELSCIFPQVPERVDEFPDLLAKNQRSAWPSNEKILVIIHLGTLKAKEAKEGYIDIWAMWLLATWQDWVSPRCSYLRWLCGEAASWLQTCSCAPSNSQRLKSDFTLYQAERTLLSFLSMKSQVSACCN